MVKQLQTGSILVNFDGLKKRESINNRIDGFPWWKGMCFFTQGRWPLTTVSNSIALTYNLSFVMVVPLSGDILQEVAARESLCSASPYL